MRLACRLSLFVVFLVSSFSVLSQELNPTPEQIERLKRLPKAQQQALAKQMGFDLNAISSNDSALAEGQKALPEAEFVEREIIEEEIAAKLAQQSVAPEITKNLKPYGYELFSNREQTDSLTFVAPTPDNYEIGIGDVLSLQLFGNESGKYSLAINSEGYVELPNLEPMSVIGLTYGEVKDLISENYKSAKLGVKTFVSIESLRPIQVFMIGEVFRPGAFLVSSMSTLTNALLNSGGVSDIGSLREIEVRRSGETVAKFDLYKLLLEGDTSNDISLRAGDVIFVPTVKRIVSVSGMVRRPAIFELKENETLNDILEFAGGILPNADASSVQIIRNDRVTKRLDVLSLDVDIPSQANSRVLNGDLIQVSSAIQEFSNAVKVVGAINTPTLISFTKGMKLSAIVKEENILNSTDLKYGLLVRKGKNEQNTLVYQFSPLDVIDKKKDFELAPMDEVILFEFLSLASNPSDDEKNEDKDKDKNEDRRESSLDTSAVSENESDGNILSEQSKTRFGVDELISENEDFSRESLLSSLLVRLRFEATQGNPVQLVEIKGEVRFPGIYPLPSDGTVMSLINAAGGLTESAFMRRAELTSFAAGELGSGIELKSIDLANELIQDEEQSTPLRSKDVLNILKIPDWFENEVVELAGEFVFPGKYQLQKGETLKQLVERAGGFTERASLGSAVFLREELKLREQANLEKAVDELRQQLANNNLSNNPYSKQVDYENAKLVLEELLDTKPVGRLVVDLENIVDGRSPTPIELKDGDKLIVSNISPAVSVIGEVFVPTTHLFEPQFNLEDYLNKSGGVKQYGDKGSIYIVRANGSVVPYSQSYWFSSEPDFILQKGDTIVVPRDLPNYDNISLWQGVTQIVYQTAVALAAIGSL